MAAKHSDMESFMRVAEILIVDDQPDQIRFAGEIHKSSQRLLTLINDIIELSELDSEKGHSVFLKPENLI